jgi:hypothetical protein
MDAPDVVGLEDRFVDHGPGSVTQLGSGVLAAACR